jgi:hypothetical protein
MRLAPRKKSDFNFVNLLYIKQIYELFQKRWQIFPEKLGVARVFYLCL